MKNRLFGRVIFYELIGFGFVIVVLWLNEFLDIPQCFFNGVSTPINYKESLFETLIIVVLGGIVIIFTRILLQRIKLLHGLLPICSWCKKIRFNGRWEDLEEYIISHSEADFTHTICPECEKKHFD